jgi:hypothetical protein
MEIDETFTTLEEIRSVLEKDGLTCRISADDESEFEDETIIDHPLKSDKFLFSSDADENEIEKWESELPDIDENEAADEDEEDFGEDDFEEEDSDAVTKTPLGKSDDEMRFENYEHADVVYFDTFKKRTYVKTYIFQKEIETGKILYRLVGFCEAPLS